LRDNERLLLEEIKAVEKQVNKKLVQKMADNGEVDKFD